jgi:serine/threonine protein kinase
LNEVKVALKVTHPNVCRVYEIGEEDPSTDTGQCISMEYVDGEDLANSPTGKIVSLCALTGITGRGMRGSDRHRSHRIE